MTEFMQDRLRAKFSEILNAESVEGGSNTPDFILAAYLVGCLIAFEEAVKQRDSFFDWAPDRAEATK